MIVQNFEIQLRNLTNNVYHSGDTIDGFISLVLNQPLDTKGVKLEITGTSHTQWKVERKVSSADIAAQITTRIYQEVCRGDEDYFRHEVVLWDKLKPLGNDTVTLQPGSYEFPFKFVIPTSCPSSFEGLNGFIRYICRVTFYHTIISTVISNRRRARMLQAFVGETGYGNNYFKCKQPFTVIHAVDLNKETVAQRPISDHFSKTMRTGIFGASGTLECRVDLPRCGYVPGEIIRFNMTLKNQTTTQIDQVTVQASGTSSVYCVTFLCWCRLK